MIKPIWYAAYPQGIPHEIKTQHQSIVDLFHDSVSRYSQNLAYENMGASLSFSDLDRQSGYFAAFLVNHLGLKKGDRIAIQLPNLLQFPVVLFGALRAGLTVVNTNPLYTEREMKHQFKDSGAKALVILKNFAHHLPAIIADTQIEHVITTELGDMLGFPKRYVVNFAVRYLKKMVPAYELAREISWDQALKLGQTQALKEPSLGPDDLAFLQYTGGTTGVAKGAMLSHSNILHNMEQISAWIEPRLERGRDSIVTALPLYHIFSLTVNALAFMKFGCANLLITNPKDIPGFIKTLKSRRYTFFSGVNTLFNALMNHPQFSRLDFSQLKVTVAGGMALQTAVAERWRKMTGQLIIEGYGLTETSPVTCCNPIDGTDQVGTIGLPLPSTEVKIIQDDGQPVALGEPGELCFRGPQVMQGYWQRPDETAKVMCDDGFLKTGDIGLMKPDGFIRIVDRKKDMILVSGFNVYPNEIEDVVVRHPEVLEAAAIGVPDEKSGEAIQLFVVPKGAGLTAESVLEFCRRELTGYKIPKYVEFRRELPKTNVGKILRRELRTTTPNATRP